MDKNKENNHLKIAHNANDYKKSDDKKQLSHEELLAEIGTKVTVMEREQVVIENLKRKGFL